MTARILLVEDDRAIATVVEVALMAEGYRIDAVGTIDGRNASLATHHYDVLITDVMLPDGDGLDALLGLDVGKQWTLPPVIVLSAQNTLGTALRASQERAFEYLPKPFDLDDLAAAVRSALGNDHGAGAVDLTLGSAADSLEVELLEGPPLIGRAPAMQQVYRTLARVAPTDLTVLILGESGTGKELVALAIHHNSIRKTGPFVAVNMAAIPRELIESDLFGHEKGSFTGALARSTGKFEQAEGGTLFLDEIGDMPLEAQTRLLRVLQSGDYTPVGSAKLRRSNVRIVAATNQDLTALVASGRFRADLYYRLNVIPLALPPLRDRASDIEILARHFLDESVAVGLDRKQFSEGGMERLTHHRWPGNVRELANVTQRLALLTRGHIIDVRDVEEILGVTSHGNDRAAVGFVHDGLDNAVLDWLRTAEAKAARETGSLHEALVRRIEHILISTVLTESDQNQVKAAAILGINRNTLRLKRRVADTVLGH